MTTPWTPAPNPGGRNREFVRKITAQWLADGEIVGLANVYPGTPLEERYDEGQPGALYFANASVHVAEISETRVTWTGPTDPGGKDAHYEVALSLKHVCTSVDEPDWWAAEDDHDRILDALKDRLRGQGRDLGRPDVILQAADWPATSLRSETDEPMYTDGVRTQWSRIFFTVSQYMQRQP